MSYKVFGLLFMTDIDWLDNVTIPLLLQIITIAENNMPIPVILGLENL